jgi:predicted naringenin-chalcone synthase
MYPRIGLFGKLPYPRIRILPILIYPYPCCLGYEKVLRLQPGKLAASRRVLSEYGNMIGPTVLFVLDEVVHRRRRRLLVDGEGEGEGCEWGLLVGLGPGFTAEVIVLRACK